jgi:K+-sensing histidine kinase KdpD
MLLVSCGFSVSRKGKVYVPRQAERALEHFFSPENLTALRELALRRTADRVDEQLLSQMQARAIQGPCAAGDRILISEDPRAVGLVRYPDRDDSGERYPHAGAELFEGRLTTLR